MLNWTGAITATPAVSITQSDNTKSAYYVYEFDVHLKLTSDSLV